LGGRAVDAPYCTKAVRISIAMKHLRIGLFLFDCIDPLRLQETVARIAAEVASEIEEIVIVDDRLKADSALLAIPEVRGLRAPRDLGYGGARKAAFEYASARGFDHVIALNGDGSHPPELIGSFLAAIERSPHALIVATRQKLSRIDRLEAFLHSRILGIRIRDPRSGYRAYPVSALGCVPYQLCARDRSFDDQILVQFRALDAEICEVESAETWGDDQAGSPSTTSGIVASLDYRLHQLHFSRRHRYMVDEGVHYKLKLSPTGSHMQIVEAIDAGSQVLDLGCSQGLLARPLAEKGVEVTGVDLGAEAGAELASELTAYYSRDLDLPLELPVARDFDYVVVADVIEHVRNRSQLLRSARRYLKSGGRLIISTPNIAIWVYRLSLLVGRFEYGPRGVLDETHVHLYTGATFRREVENAGFEILDQRVTALPFEVVFESTGRSRAVGLLAGFYHAVARAWPSMFAYQYILEARITTFDEDA